MAYSKEQIRIISEKRVEKEKQHLDIYLTFHEMLRSGSQVFAAGQEVASRFGVTFQTVWNVRNLFSAEVEFNGKNAEHVKKMASIYPEFKERFNEYESARLDSLLQKQE